MSEKIEDKIDQELAGVIAVSVRLGFLKGCQTCVGDRHGVAVFQLSQATGKIDLIIQEILLEAGK